MQLNDSLYLHKLLASKFTVPEIHRDVSGTCLGPITIYQLGAYAADQFAYAILEVLEQVFDPAIPYGTPVY